MDFFNRGKVKKQRKEEAERAAREVADQGNKQIRLSLSANEVNTLIQILANQPFGQVHMLIARIHNQFAPQMQPAQAPPAEQNSEVAHP